MQRIPQDAIVGWGTIGNQRFATNISTRCPFCGTLATFGSHSANADPQNVVVSTAATCPKCKSTFRLINVRHADLTDVYMYPGAHETYQSASVNADFPEPLKRSFQAALDAFDAGNYPATAVTAGRTLEGIFKHLVSQEQRGKNLAALIEAVVSTDLAQPIRDLGHAMRDGRNIAAHFDLESEPDKDLARHMIELLDYLISYLYVLPKRIDNLRSILDRDDSPSEPIVSSDQLQ